MDKRKFFLGLVALIFFGCVVGLIGMARENSKLKTVIQGLKKDPQLIAKEEVKMLTEKVSKLVVLPSDEEAVLATVTDKEKLKDQPIFAKADNGDKILIYAKAKKAYVYRPSTNLIIDVIPVNIGDNNVGAMISGVSTDNPLKIALVNGTKTAGIANELEKRIVDRKIAGLSVILKATAKKSDYVRTLVIDETGKFKTQAEQLAKLLDADVASESAEIMAKNADLMVIIGSNFK